MTGYQVLQSLPRLVRDVEAVRAEAARLREQMSVAKADIVKVHTVHMLFATLVLCPVSST